jgi:hypothetical protein
VIAAILAAAAGLAAGPAAAGRAPELAQIRALEGEWEGRDADGKVSMRTRIRAFAGGQSVLEEQSGPEGHEMVTVYHTDGEELVLTHYCAVGNQPRMKAVSSERGGATIPFVFAGATNLPDSKAGHMHAMTLTIEDRDHFTQAWTWSENGQEKEPHVIRFTRRK